MINLYFSSIILNHLNPTMKKHLSVIFSTCVLFSNSSFSQDKLNRSLSKAFTSKSTGFDYTTAVGVKFYPGAISAKHFIKSKAAIEGLLYVWNYGARITGLYEFHFPINDVTGLKWYAGPGAHIGFWNDRWRDDHPDYYTVNEYRGTHFGFDGVLGLDYKFERAPLNLSLDWQPSFNLGSGPGSYYGFYSGFGGLGIRYTF